MPTPDCTIGIMSTFCSGYERLVQGRDLSPHFVFGERNLSVECGKSRRNNVYRGGIVHGNLREKTPTNRACIPRSRLRTPMH